MSLPSKELSDAALDALVARERTRVVAPLTDWRVLSAQLRDEGLVRSEAERDVPDQHPPSYTDIPRPRSGLYFWSRRLAASIFLLGGGVLIGRSITLGSQIVPMIKGAIESDSIVDATRPRMVKGARVMMANGEMAEAFRAHATGVVVLAVEPGSPAERAGFEVGDIIVSVNSKPVLSLSTFVRAINGPAAGAVPLVLDRGGKKQDVILRW